MPRHANERTELYCLHRAKGMVPRKAAIAAGYAQGSSIYSTLEDDPEVLQRISELTHDIQLKREQQRAAAIEAARMVGQVTGMSKSWVLQQLAEGVVAARADGCHKEANEALKLIGEEFGMFRGGSSSENDDAKTHQVIDLDKTDALLDAAQGAMKLPAPNLPADPLLDKPIDMELVDRLIKGNKPIRARDRELSTGSETDVAFTADGEVPSTE